MKIIASALVMIVSSIIAITSFFTPWFTFPDPSFGPVPFVYPLNYFGYAMIIAPLLSIVTGIFSIFWHFQFIPRGTITWVRIGSFISGGITLTSLIVFGLLLANVSITFIADENDLYIISYNYSPYFLGLLGIIVSAIVIVLACNKMAMMISKPQKIAV